MDSHDNRDELVTRLKKRVKAMEDEIAALLERVDELEGR